MSTEELMKEWIDNASYEDLLRRWRNAPAGDPYFQGEMGGYYREVLAKRRSQESDSGVGASKRIG